MVFSLKGPKLMGMETFVLVAWIYAGDGQLEPMRTPGLTEIDCPPESDAGGAGSRANRDVHQRDQIRAGPDAVAHPRNSMRRRRLRLATAETGLVSGLYGSTQVASGQLAWQTA